MPRPALRLGRALLVVSLAACTASPPPSASPAGVGSPPPGRSPTTSLGSPTAPAASASPSPSPRPSPSLSPSPTPGGLPSPSASPSPSPSPADLAAAHAEQLQAALEQQRVLRRIPGLAGVVVFPDGSRWSGATGDAALDPRRPVTRETRFVVGSITKTFVAALALQLAQEGVLDLDARLSRWLPDYPRSQRITLRQLLAHTSGVFNYFEHPRYEALVFGRPDHRWTPEEILETFERPPYFAPGAGFHYSNTNFVLLGLVIEKATESSLEELFEDRFLGPLGLDDTYFQQSDPPPGAAHGYLRMPDGHRQVSDASDYRPTTSAATVAWAAGAMVSTAEDLAAWAEGLYGGDLLSPESKQQLLDYRYSPYALQSYALGTRTRLTGTSRAFGHTGSLRGYMAAMWHYPEEDVSVVVLTNVGRIDGNRVSDALATLVLPEPALPGGPAPVAPTPAAPTPRSSPLSSPAPSGPRSPAPASAAPEASYPP